MSTEAAAPAAPAEPEAKPTQREIPVTRKQFNAARVGKSLLPISQAEAEAAGTTVSGSPVVLIEHLEGFPTGRWLATAIDQIYPREEGGFHYVLAHPPVSFADVHGAQVVEESAAP